MHSGHCDATGERSPCTNLKIREEMEDDNRKGCLSKHDYLTLKNQPESSIYEAIFLESIDDISVNLTRNGEPNNLYLYIARDGY